MKVDREKFFTFLESNKENFSVDRESMHSTGVVPSASVVNFWMKLSTVDETEKFIYVFFFWKYPLKEFLGHCFATNALIIFLENHPLKTPIQKL